MKSSQWKMELFCGLCFMFVGLTRLIVKDTLGFIIFILMALLCFVVSYATTKK